MIWNKFLTYGDSQPKAFETLCNQLFERYLKRNYGDEVTKFRVINGSAGDGGIEAYGQLSTGKIIAVQAKWFRGVIKERETKQIRNSVMTAKDLRPSIAEYIICIPHDVGSLKYGRGKKNEKKKPIDNFEQKTIDAFTEEMKIKFPDLIITWWFEKDIESELLHNDNEGVSKYWFDREVISFQYLSKHFDLQKTGWLYERYTPELHGQGLIDKEYQKVCFTLNYRNELLVLVNQVVNDINYCAVQIERFIPTNHSLPDLTESLKEIYANLMLFKTELSHGINAIETGNDLYKPHKKNEVDIWAVKHRLEKLSSDNLQKSILPKLISALEKVHDYELTKFIEQLGLSIRQSVRLILGDSGTGKTHGLSNCVEMHLANHSPAIILQAKGSDCNNWTTLLARATQLHDWRKEEIFSALESLAIRNDIKKAEKLEKGEEPVVENSKVLICIDGLEEDIENEKEWYSRIRECELFVKEYPRLRFMFSARQYFYKASEIPKEKTFGTLSLPREGDVRIVDVAPKYFSAEHYNIRLSSYSKIRGINSLFALRLFCDEYRNREISETDDIVTATRDLINLKINRLNQEYISSLQKKISLTRNPVSDSLAVIATYFYRHREIDHEKLVDLIDQTTKTYLGIGDIDSLIDYLSQNAFLIKSERIKKGGVLIRKEYYYNITYQSLIEHIISENIYHEIKEDSLQRIPDFLHQTILGRSASTYGMSHEEFDLAPNQKIIQNIASNLFNETGQLIGDDDFLTEGFDEWEIKALRLIAISHAPASLALKYKDYIDTLFFSGYTNLTYVLEYLILPSSLSARSVYGSVYLHQSLLPLSVFERDKLWSGLDRFEEDKLSASQEARYLYKPVSTILKDFGAGRTILNESEVYNGTPLLLAWGLTTIDQELRSNLRVTLTDWAITNPGGFLSLLEKIFNCNDPQIQEDLASVALGVASRVKDAQGLKKISQWAQTNIFAKPEQHRNVIVRQGFRAISEKAFQMGAITKTEVDLCRPKLMHSITLLPLERTLESNGRECYPIVHDLAWYVIGKSYSAFLEDSTSPEKTVKNKLLQPAQVFLEQYRKVYNDKKIFSANWAMAAALAFIKSLGFTRTEGNWYTLESHGGKSKIFTYEEKYTWLAVHFIQGYLSDYLPMKHWSGERIFVKDYSQITDIPNPAELLTDASLNAEKTSTGKDWVVKEMLSNELDASADIRSSIKKWINNEPELNLENWLTFDSADFQLTEPNRKWTAILNETRLHDSKRICYSSITFTACLIKKSDLTVIREIINRDPDSLYFTTHMDGLHSIPRTDTYCNPTDIVWMNWIEEDNVSGKFYSDTSDKEHEMLHSVTEVIQNNGDGEKYLKLPSKKVRELIHCYELINGELKDATSKTLAFIHRISDGSMEDGQEIILVDSDVFDAALQLEDLELIWFIELFKRKNLLNKNLDKIPHTQRTRKYFAWTENGRKKSCKFWDERSSNQRDKKVHKRNTIL